MPDKAGFLARSWKKLRPMILPTAMLYCGYKGLSAGLDEHDYSKGTYYLFIGYLVFVFLREEAIEQENRDKKQRGPEGKPYV
jgi:hypothetical protein